MNNTLFTFDVDETLRSIQEARTVEISRISKISSTPNIASNEISKISEISKSPSENLAEPVNNISAPPPANSAKAANLEKIVKCHDCEHFIPSTAGNGAGVGRCNIGVHWTQEDDGPLALYRLASRHCVNFSKSMD